MCRWFILLGVLGVGSLALPLDPVSGDTECIGWDDQIEDSFFNPLKKEIAKSSDGFLTIVNKKTELVWMVYNVVDGKIGNLSSFDLYKEKGATGSSSQLCTEGTNNKTLIVQFEFSDVNANFGDSLSLDLMIFALTGGVRNSFSNTGNKLVISLSFITGDKKDCTVNVNYFQLVDMGTTLSEMYLSVFGFKPKLFSGDVSKLLWNLLNGLGMTDYQDTVLRFIATNVISKYGNTMCQLMADS